jgi:hypothetical protein
LACALVLPLIVDRPARNIDCTGNGNILLDDVSAPRSTSYSQFFYAAGIDHLCCGSERQRSWCRLSKTSDQKKIMELSKQNRPRCRRNLWPRARSREVLSRGRCYRRHPR